MSNQTRFGLTEDEQVTLAALAKKVLEHTLQAQPPEYRDGDTVLAGFEVKPVDATGNAGDNGILVILAQGDARKLLREAVTSIANKA
jgi:hypothetical protein